MTRILTVAIFSIFFSLTGLSQTAFKSIPLQFTSPEQSVEELKVLAPHFENVKVVGMGESTHGTHEFFEMRHRLFKYLVLHHGYNTFFLEADYGNCLRVDRYIKGAEDDLQAVTSGLGLWPWITAEMATLIEWMRAYNLNPETPSLHFIGCDMQQVNRTIEEIDRIIIKHDPSRIDSSEYIDISQKEFFLLKDPDTIKRYRQLLASKKRVGEQLPIKGEERFHFETLLLHFDQIITSKEKPKFRSFRDYKMGENIIHHLRHRPEAKGFFWAHNLHIAKFYREKKKESNSFFTAGGVLKKKLGEQYFIIGQEFNKGSFNAYYRNREAPKSENVDDYTLGSVSIDPLPNTLARRFDQVDGNIHFLLINEIPEKEIEDIWIHDIGAAYHPPKRIKAKKPTNWYLTQDAFDAFIFIKETSATQLLR